MTANMTVKKLYRTKVTLSDQVKRFMVGCVLYIMGISTANCRTAVDSVVNNSDNLKPWLLTLVAIRCSDYYYEEYLKYIEDPSSTNVFDNLFKEHPEIPATLKASCDAKLLSIERGTRLFPGCDLSSNIESNQEITISVGPTASNPEVVENTFEKLYKQPTGKDYLKGSVNLVVPRYLKQMKFFVKAHQNTPATMNLSELLRQIALLIIAESKDETVPRPGTRTSFDNVRGKLVADEWSTVDIVRLLDSALLRRLVKEYRRVCVHTAPDRNFNRPIIVAMMYQRVGAREGPINPTEFDYLLEEGENARPAYDDAAINDAAPQQRVAPQPTVPRRDAPQQEVAQQPVQQEAATERLQPGAPQDAPQQEEPQQELPQQDAATADAATERPQSTISNDQGEHYDSMDDQGGEEFEALMLDDDVAADPEQNPGDIPNPAATQGAISKRPNQANNEANLEAGSSAGSSADLSYLAANRGRKRGVEEVLQEPQGSSTPNPKRLETAEARAVFQEMFIEAQKEMEARIDANTARIETVAGNTRANAAAIEIVDGNTRANAAAIETVAVDTQANTARIRTVAGETQANTARIETIDGATQANTARIETIDGNTQANTAAIATVDGNTQANTAAIATVDGATQANAARIETVDGDTRANAAAIAAVDGATRIHSAAIEAVAGATRAHTATLNIFTGFFDNTRANEEQQNAERAKEDETGTQRNTRTGNGGPNFLPRFNAEAARQREATQKSASDGPKGEDAAGAIPKQVVREPETETAATEAKEDEAGEDEASAKTKKIKKAFLATLLCIAVTFGGTLFLWPGRSTATLNATSSALLSVGMPAFFLGASSVETPRINCDNGKEAAAAFCRESECVEEVYKLCRDRGTNKNYWHSGKFNTGLIMDDNRILKRFM